MAWLHMIVPGGGHFCLRLATRQGHPKDGLRRSQSIILLPIRAVHKVVGKEVAIVLAILADNEVIQVCSRITALSFASVVHLCQSGPDIGIAAAPSCRQAQSAQIRDAAEVQWSMQGQSTWSDLSGFSFSRLQLDLVLLLHF